MLNEKTPGFVRADVPAADIAAVVEGFLGLAAFIGGRDIERPGEPVRDWSRRAQMQAVEYVCAWLELIPAPLWERLQRATRAYPSLNGDIHKAIGYGLYAAMASHKGEFDDKKRLTEDQRRALIGAARRVKSDLVVIDLPGFKRGFA